MNEKDLIALMDPKMIDEEVRRLNNQYYVKTTQCFDRLFGSGAGTEVLGTACPDGAQAVYRDLISRVGSAPLGNDATLKESAAKYVTMHGYRNAVPHHESPDMQSVLLASELAQRMPSDEPYKVYFGQSGTEAVEAWLKFARDWYARKNELHRKTAVAAYGAFHGRTAGSLSFSTNPVHRQGFLVAVNDVMYIPYPASHPYFVWTRDPAKNPDTQDAYKIARFDFSTCTVEEYRRAYLDPLIPHADNIFTFIVEDGVMGEGGMNVGRTDILKETYEFFRKRGILVGLDAVQSGIGRTGTLFAFEQAGFAPDGVMAAKGLSDGLPQSATIIASRIAPIKDGRHSNTNGGNPFISFVSRLALSEIRQRKLLERVTDVSRRIIAPVLAQDFSGRFEEVHKAQTLGFMGGIEFWNPKAKEPDRQLRDAVITRGIAQGLLLLSCGIAGIRIMPPLTISEEALVVALRRLAACIKTALDDRARMRAS